jgi:hypothetical protein
MTWTDNLSGGACYVYGSDNVSGPSYPFPGECYYLFHDDVADYLALISHGGTNGILLDWWEIGLLTDGDKVKLTAFNGILKVYLNDVLIGTVKDRGISGGFAGAVNNWYDAIIDDITVKWDDPTLGQSGTWHENYTDAGSTASNGNLFLEHHNVEDLGAGYSSSFAFYYGANIFYDIPMSDYAGAGIELFNWMDSNHGITISPEPNTDYTVWEKITLDYDGVNVTPSTTPGELYIYESTYTPDADPLPTIPGTLLVWRKIALWELDGVSSGTLTEYPLERVSAVVLTPDNGSATVGLTLEDEGLYKMIIGNMVLIWRVY